MQADFGWATWPREIVPPDGVVSGVDGAILVVVAGHCWEQRDSGDSRQFDDIGTSNRPVAATPVKDGRKTCKPYWLAESCGGVGKDSFAR